MRTVAFFDILGFRNLIANTPVEELGPRFGRMMDTVFKSMNRPASPGEELPRLLADHSDKPFCISHVFSDSIILISHDDTEHSALAVLIFSLRAMQALIAAGFPVRAAIVHGEMYVDESKSLFLGSALTRAFDLQEQQEWIGGVVDDSVLESFPGLVTDSMGDLMRLLFPSYSVPFKQGPIRHIRAINWRWNLYVADGTRSLFPKTTEWEHWRKVENTFAFARWVRNSGFAYPSDPESLPIEVRAFLVGKGPPPPLPLAEPFRHGDDL